MLAGEHERPNLSPQYLLTADFVLIVSLSHDLTARIIRNKRIVP
jgi:hypothetical protein